ncbi:MAG: DUF370 domain-containing protein [Defluviitaleaceae bacterium]|nr:DUF370 domain-containing protein [Defluviitaleaceae bacterium]
MKPINIGYGNIVMMERIVAIVSPESAPIKRVLQDAKEQKQVIDATYGRRTRSIIFTDAGFVILSPLQPETLAGRALEIEKTEKTEKIDKI